MLPVLRAEDVRAADAAAVAAGTSIATLMARAGWAVAAVASRLAGGAYGKRFVVVCGSGNNAGDGLVAARILARWGARVEVVGTFGDRFDGAATAARAGWPGPVLDADGIHDALERADLVIDALFGVGLSRDVDGIAAKVILAINGSGVPVLAIDLPSGIDADTGRVRGDAIVAAATVTLGGTKPGLRFPPGRAHAGRLEIADLGLPSLETPVRALELSDVAARWPLRADDAHKRSAGTLLLVAGSETMPGAAILAARAAVAAGVGLLQVAAPRAILAAIVANCPEAIAVPYDAAVLDAAHARALIERAARSDAIAIGPGLGRDVATLAAVRTLLEHVDVPAIVDADALHAIPIVARTAPTVVTPHAGEWGVIVETEAARADVDRLRAARVLVETLEPRLPGVIGVLKGAGTVIATMDTCLLDLEAGPELAQAGTGDVLTGILGALAAACTRSRRPLDAETIAAGVWVHARAGTLAGPTAAGASRVIERIPDAIAQAVAS